MITVREIRQRFLIGIGVMAAICIACIVYLAMPANRDTQEKKNAINSATLALHQDEIQVAPLRGLDQKLVRSKEDISSFYNSRFPDRYSDITQTLNDLANESHVTVSNVTYGADYADVEDLQQIAMRATLSGKYEDLMDYVDSVDHSDLFFLIDDINVGHEKEGGIKLELTLETYLRGGGTPPPNANGPRA
jgi:Tfp pilus assembly protein PilO